MVQYPSEAESEKEILEWANDGWTSSAKSQVFNSEGRWLVVNQTWGSGVTYTNLLLYHFDEFRKMWCLSWVTLDYFGFLKTNLVRKRFEIRDANSGSLIAILDARDPGKTR